MKIITKTTINVGKAPDVESLAPGVHDLGDDLATWLLKRGKAELADRPPADLAEKTDDKPPADDKQSRGQNTGRR